MKRYMIVEPPGGLCNRMNVIRFSYLFAKKNDYKFVVLWNNNHELGCDYDDIFQPGDYKVISLKWPQKAISELWKTKKMFQLGYALLFWSYYKLLQKILMKFVCVISTRHQGQTQEDYVEYCNEKFLQHEKNIIFYKQHLHAVMDYSDYSMLVFRPEFIQKAEGLLKNGGDRVLGVHIRRTDHTICMKMTQLDIFIEKMKVELTDYPDTKFYLATDEEKVLSELKHLFPGKIIYNEQCERNRDSEEGIFSAVVDIVALSKTQKIIGSNGSSFSYLSGFMGGIVVEYYYPPINRWEDFCKVLYFGNRFTGEIQ